MLKICAKFKKGHWGNRWYSRSKYNAMFPTMWTHNSNTNMVLNNNTEDHRDVHLGVASLSEDHEMAVDDQYVTDFD